MVVFRASELKRTLPGIVIICLVATGLAVYQSTRRPANVCIPATPPAQLFSRCAALASSQDLSVERAAVLFAHHEDSRFSIPMILQLTEVAGRTSKATVFVIVAPEPDSVASKIGGVENNTAAVVGRRWLKFAPHDGDRVILPALVLLKHPGIPVLRWVGGLDGRTLKAALEAFSSGVRPTIHIPAEGDSVPIALLEKLEWAHRHRTTEDAEALLIMFVDSLCKSCEPYLREVLSRTKAANIRRVVVTSRPYPEDRSSRAESLASRVVVDPDYELYAQMRISIVPTLVLVNGDGLIAARIDGVNETEIVDGVLEGIADVGTRHEIGANKSGRLRR